MGRALAIACGDDVDLPVPLSALSRLLRINECTLRAAARDGRLAVYDTRVKKDVNQSVQLAVNIPDNDAAGFPGESSFSQHTPALMDSNF